EGAAPAAPTWQEPAAATPEGLQESQAAFDEIQQFAETGESPVALAIETPMEIQAKPATPSKTKNPAPRPAASGDQIMTSGDGLPGYRIESYLPPVSASANLDSDSSNPMHKGFAALWEEAVKEGATGVVAVRWVLSPDGNRVILSGTPVICRKEST